MFWNKSEWIVLKGWDLRFFIASGFMSTAVMFFGFMNFDAIFGRIPEPVPISR